MKCLHCTAFAVRTHREVACMRFLILYTATSILLHAGMLVRWELAVRAAALHQTAASPRVPVLP